MGNYSIYLSTVIISIFPLILYWLSLIYSVFFSKKGKNLITRELYECGFKALNDNNSVLDSQYILIGLIFIIYEMELIIFAPIFLNYNSFTFFTLFLIVVLFIVFILSYIYEIEKYTFIITF